MDDSVSVKSIDSANTSDEYEIVSPVNNNAGKVEQSSNENRPPLLKIADGDLVQLQKCLGEMLSEMEACDKVESKDTPKEIETPTETHTDAANTENDEEQIEQNVFQDCTLFGCISYLGSAAINAPKSKNEIIRNMSILNEQSTESAIQVSLSVPNFADGVVVLYDSSNNVIVTYEIGRIMFYANGADRESSCFAFTYLHGDGLENTVFQCHVFRCDIPEAVGQVTLCFGKAFQRPSATMSTSTLSFDQTDSENGCSQSTHTFVLEMGLEVKESDGKGNYVTVPRDRNALKLRTNVNKQIQLNVQQLLKSNQEILEIERCFGVLVSPGWNVKHSDMQLLDMITMNAPEDEDGSGKPALYTITGNWGIRDPNFDSLNNEQSKFRLTIAIDLVVRKIKDPVRLTIETQAKMYPQHERFWSLTRGQIYHEFYFYLKEAPSRNGSLDPGYEVVSIERSFELDKSILPNWSNLTNLMRSTSSTSLEDMSPKDDHSDTDEPVISGSGEVSKECPGRELELWHELLARWTSGKAKPKQLYALVQQGIPEALRGEVWLRLSSNGERDNELMNIYRLLIAKECSAEAVIQRDINRTFPAHDFFKDAGGVGQDTLFNISKAYAVYDTEIGYCQGLTFIAASLLLHMPEEQAFCVLVHLMYNYGLRNLYRDGFENLNMKLYQLTRLLEEKDPELYQHFSQLGVETHMFASHWFLTLYTARFPLYFVYFIIDVVLVHGMDTVFQVALSLLVLNRKELLALDFENVLKFFQVTLPKKCRSEWSTRRIIKKGCNIKLKKLKKYEREFLALKAAEQNEMQYNNELERLEGLVHKLEEDKIKLQDQLSQAKESLFLEMQKGERESKRNASIIADYKEIPTAPALQQPILALQICHRVDAEQTAMRELLNALQAKISKCQDCSSFMIDLLKDEKGSQSLNNNEEDINSVAASATTELELELAQTKLALVEAQCRNQDLTHELNSTMVELSSLRNLFPPWMKKTLSSIKEVTANKKV